MQLVDLRISIVRIRYLNVWARLYYKSPSKGQIIKDGLHFENKSEAKFSKSAKYSLAKRLYYCVRGYTPSDVDTFEP